MPWCAMRSAIPFLLAVLILSTGCQPSTSTSTGSPKATPQEDSVVPAPGGPFGENCSKDAPLGACAELFRELELSLEPDLRLRQQVRLALQERCDAGGLDECRVLKATNPYRGFGPSEWAVAHKAYGERCDFGDLRACEEWIVLMGRIDGYFFGSRELEGEYSKACRSGDAAACRNYGLKQHGFLSEFGSRGDEVGQAFKTSCEGKDAVGCLYWGLLQRDGRRTAVDLAGALTSFEAACVGFGSGPGANRTATGCGEWADLLRAQESPEKADAALQIGCEAGDPNDCIARLLPTLGDEARVDDVLAELDGLCTAKFSWEACAIADQTRCERAVVDGGACARWARAQERGLGTPRARQGARASFDRACAAGVEDACVHSARMSERLLDLEFGLFGGATPEQAALYVARCDAGEALACLFMANWAGYGAEAEAQELTYAQRGCELGSAEACEVGASYLRQQEPTLGVNPMLEKSCELGDLRGCSQLAYAKGNPAGLPLHERACEGGAAASCYERGAVAVYAAPNHLAEGLPFLKRGCELGHEPSCVVWIDAEIRQSRAAGDLTLPTEDERRNALDAHCESGLAMACRQMGIERQHKADFKGAAAPFEKACTGGDGNGCELLSRAFDGTLSQDGLQSYWWMRRACHLGSLWACKDFAEELAYGRTFGVDIDRALELQQANCQSPEMYGCTDAALLSDRAELLSDDAKAARTLYEKTCANDPGKHPYACFNLARVQREGRGGPRDEVASRAGFEATCKAGSAPACLYAGLAHEESNSLEASEEWYDLACAGGEQEGCVVAAFIDEDAERAVEAGKAFDALCEARFGAACRHLGLEAYRRGEKEVAIERFRLACDLHEAASCAGLALLTADPEQADAVYNRACAYRDMLACTLTREELGGADWLERVAKESPPPIKK